MYSITIPYKYKGVSRIDSKKLLWRHKRIGTLLLLLHYLANNSIKKY